MGRGKDLLRWNHSTMVYNSDYRPFLKDVCNVANDGKDREQVTFGLNNNLNDDLKWSSLL